MENAKNNKNKYLLYRCTRSEGIGGNKRLFVQKIIFSINFQITRSDDFSMSKLMKLLKLAKNIIH